MRNAEHALKFVLIAAIIGLPACSLMKNKHSADNGVDGRGAFEPETTAAPLPGMAEAEVVADLHPTDLHQVSQVDPPKSEGDEATQAGARPPAPAESPESRQSNFVSYRVRAGDTLMKIAFERYGDFLKWREIAADNTEALKGGPMLSPGTSLRLRAEEVAAITRNGEPYLIHRYDTLAKIARKVYGTTAEWKRIWKNNPELIRDPHWIYAGFRLYYAPREAGHDPETERGSQILGQTTAPRTLAGVAANAAH